MSNSNEPIDLSKYAAGKKLRAVSDGNYLRAGQVYESSGDVCQQHEYQTVKVDDRRFCVDLFVPVEDEAAVCLCGPMHDNGRSRSCPEHGVRCNRADCDKLCDGMDAVAHYNGQRRDYCSRACHDLVHPDFAKRPAPPVATIPPADPYETHRRELVQRLTRNGFQPHPDKKHASEHQTKQKALSAVRR